MGKVSELIMGHQAAVLGSASVLLAAGVAWGLSTQPLVPREAAAGSAGSSISAAALGSSAAPGRGPADEKPDERADGAEGGGAGDPAPVEEDAVTLDDTAAQKDPSPAPKPSSDGGPDQSQNQKPVATAPAQRPPKPSGGEPAPAQKPPKPSGGSSGQAVQTPAEPQHSHSFQPVYRTDPVYGQQWVSNWVDVYKGRVTKYTCNGCGAAWSMAHATSFAKQGDTSHGTYVDDSYDIWEKEDHGSYQQVQTGTKQVLDHHECPCGAVK